jgi:hypothetical protein
MFKRQDAFFQNSTFSVKIDGQTDTTKYNPLKLCFKQEVIFTVNKTLTAPLLVFWIPTHLLETRVDFCIQKRERVLFIFKQTSCL